MITVVKAGLYSSIQDVGRFGYRKIGVPLSGSMDQFSAVQANLMLGNAEGDAVLEITLLGPTLKFQQATTIAITGAPFTTGLNDADIILNRAISVKKNDVLVFGKAKKGMRCYMAVSGGFQTPLVLGSRSFYKTITTESVLKNGDKLPIAQQQAFNKIPNHPIKTLHFETTTLEVYPAEFSVLSKLQQKALLKNDFKISAQSNRMGYVLERDAGFSAKEILTAPVQPGTVQLTPSGNLIVLMRDAQVTGGYARIFQLTELSMNILAQKRGGEEVNFTLAYSPS